MLLRGSQDYSGFTVPVVKRRAIEKVDPARDKLERITGEAVAKRDSADARVSATLEGARSRAQLLDMLNQAEEAGDVSEGFAKQFAHELKKAKDERFSRAVNPEALSLLKGGSDDMDRDLQLRALRAEAGARTRERVMGIGRMIDDLVSAAQAAPQSFETHYLAGRDAVSALKLPAKVVAAFRARLPEIPRAALRALAEKEPGRALDLIERRKGPAHPKFGVQPAVVHMIAKQARAKLEEDEAVRSIDDDTNVIRALADRDESVAAYRRGETAEAALSLRGLDGVGASRLRQLRQEGRDIRQQRRRQEIGAAKVRKRLAQGLKLDADDEAQAEGLDLLYRRSAPGTTNDIGFAATAGTVPKALMKKIGDLVLSDDDARVVEGVKLVQALEAIEPDLVKRLNRHVLDEAYEVIDIVESGVDWSEAARLARQRADVPATERERRSQRFAEQSDPAWVARLLQEALGLTRDEPEDGPVEDAPHP